MNINLTKFQLDAAKGDYSSAKNHLLQPLSLAVMTASQPYATIILALAALINASDGRPRKAVELLGLVLSQPAFITNWIKQTAQSSDLHSVLQGSLSSDEFEAVWKRGQSMDLMAASKQFLKTIESNSRES